MKSENPNAARLTRFTRLFAASVARLVTRAACQLTNCDVYVYSFSRADLSARMRRLIDAYNDALELAEAGCTVEECTGNDELDRIKWTGTLKQSLRREEPITFDESRIREVLYRPFTKLWLYEDDRIVSSVKTISAMFPKGEQEVESTHTHRGQQPFQQNQILDSRNRIAARPQHSRRRMPGDAPAQMILMSSPSNRTVFAALAAARLPDLRTLDPACRATPRRGP